MSSIDHVEKLLTELWEATGISEAGLSKRWPIPALESVLQDLNSDERVPDQRPELLLYENVLSWLIQVPLLLFKEVMRSRGSRRNRVRAIWSLTTSIASQCLALRVLILSGHDLPARQVARSIREYCDVAVLLTFKPELCPDFVATQDEVTSNAFWYKHVSKGRLRNQINKYVSARAPNDEAGSEFKRHLEAMQAWRDTEDKAFSMATHPSYVVGFVTYFSWRDDLEKERSYPGYWGIQNDSGRALLYAASSIFDFCLFSPLYSGVGGKPLLQLKPDNPLSEFCYKGSTLAQGLCALIVHGLPGSSD